jgi:hypothetical protein
VSGSYTAGGEPARVFAGVPAGMRVAAASAVRWLSSIALAITIGGCDGTLREKPSAGLVDASALAAVPTPPCDPPMTAGDGNHHPGEDCLMCHYQGGEGPPFTFGGTLFTAAGGATPHAGATLHLIDAVGTDVVVVSQLNGNFWSTDLVTFPVVAFGSLCPNVVPMLGPLGERDGSCNKAGCHTSGFRVHVPAP